MDPAAFDAFSRSLGGGVSRRTLLARLAGSLAPLATFPLRGEVTAKKKRRRKRKRKRKPTTPPPDGCSPGRVDCSGHCRLPDLALCSDHAECCSNLCVSEQCRPCLGQVCQSDGDCCPGVSCLGISCGGCKISGQFCDAVVAPCCFSECNQFPVGFLCQSLPGQRCTFGNDCKSCSDSQFDPDECAAACVAGTCACPTVCEADPDCCLPEVCIDGTCTCLTQCCFDSDCEIVERCQGGTCVPIIGGG